MDDFDQAMNWFLNVCMACLPAEALAKAAIGLNQFNSQNETHLRTDH
jgi:hypothetical protein